jgi:hypothetical protein
MASISSDKSGNRTIQFKGSEGPRRSIRLGKVSLKTARAVKRHVEHLIGAKLARHAIDDDVARWLGDIGDALHNKLARVGLVQPRSAATLAKFLDGYIASRIDLKPGTRNNLTYARNELVEFFGADKPLRDILPGGADEWRLWLLEKMGENTARRYCGRAKQFFKAAVRKGLVRGNPFADLVCNVQGNHVRFHFVSREELWRTADAERDSGALVAAYQLGARPHHGPLAQDGAPSRRRVSAASPLSRVEAVLGGGVRPSVRGGDLLHHPLP